MWKIESVTKWTKNEWYVSRSQWSCSRSVGLRPLDCWNRGFESRWEKDVHLLCLLCVLLVKVSARSRTACVCAWYWNFKTRLSGPDLGCRAAERKNNVNLQELSCHGTVLFFVLKLNIDSKFYIHGSVHRDSILIRSIKIQQYAGVYLLQNHSTCFGCLSHPSSGVHQQPSASVA